MLFATALEEFTYRGRRPDFSSEDHQCGNGCDVRQHHEQLIGHIRMTKLQTQLQCIGQAEQQTGRTAGNRTTVIALRLRLFNFVRTVELRKAECG